MVRVSNKILCFAGIILFVISFTLEMCIHKFFSAVKNDISRFRDSTSKKEGNETLKSHDLGQQVVERLSDENGHSVGIYYSNWSPYSPRLFFPHDIDISKISHVYYAFFLVDGEGGNLKSSDKWSDFQIDMYKPMFLQLSSQKSSENFNSNASEKKVLPMGCIGELFYLRHMNLSKYASNSTNFKLIMSVGGWSNREAFPIMVRDSKKVDIFIDSCINNMLMYGFDGIDLDWEFPEDDGFEPQMYLNIIKRLKEKMIEIENNIFKTSDNNTLNRHFELSMATPAFEEKLKILPIKDIDKYIDKWNMMTYDYSGEWSEYTGYHSNLYSGPTLDKRFGKRSIINSDSSLGADSAIKYMKEHLGIESKKIILGMAAYGRGFSGVSINKEDSNYTGKKFKKVSGYTSDEPGIWPYNKLPFEGSEEHFDSEAVSAYCLDRKTNTFVGYDNPQSMITKAQYVKDNKLGGGFWWEACGENNRDPKRSLVTTFTGQLTDINKSASIFTNRETLKYYLEIFGDKGFLSHYINYLLNNHQ